MFVAQDDERSKESWESIGVAIDCGSSRTQIALVRSCATASAVENSIEFLPGFLALLVILGYKHASASADEERCVATG
jgi:hypothetical protein